MYSKVSMFALLFVFKKWWKQCTTLTDETWMTQQTRIKHPLKKNTPQKYRWNETRNFSFHFTCIFLFCI